MTLGLGVDIVEIRRIKEILSKSGDHFLRRVFTDKEIAASTRIPAPECHLAGRWAAKEALSKALGCGIGAACGFADVEVVNDERGCPCLRLTGNAAETAARLGARRIHLSISHERSYAVAVVILDSAQG